MSGNEEALIFSKSLALIEKTKRRVLQIDGTGFPTPSSEEARSLLLEALGAMEAKDLWPSMSPEALYNALIRIQGLVEEVEASTSDRISWPLVSYCDHIWRSLFPGRELRIFYSLTNLHNYTISSFTQRLENLLCHVLPKAELGRVLGGTTLYCLQLASLEEENLPLYANIGHEFGHALHWSRRQTLLTLLELECKPVVDLIRAEHRARDAGFGHKKRTDRTIWIVNALATELFCDLIGAHIAGPAFLLSLQEMGWGTNQDVWSAILVPKNDEIHAYPSFKFRLQAVKRQVGIDVFGQRVRKVFQGLFDDPLEGLYTYLAQIASDGSADRVRVSSSPESDSDSKAIEEVLALALPELKGALDRFLGRCKSEFLPGLAGDAGEVPVSDEDVSALLKRLEANILPNIVPNGTLLGVPASFATILNASALHRVKVLLKRDPKDGAKKMLDGLQKLERLTAKAFEVSYIQRQYNEWKRRGKSP